MTPTVAAIAEKEPPAVVTTRRAWRLAEAYARACFLEGLRGPRGEDRGAEVMRHCLARRNALAGMLRDELKLLKRAGLGSTADVILSETCRRVDTLTSLGELRGRSRRPVVPVAYAAGFVA